MGSSGTDRLRDELRIRPGSRVHLGSFDVAATHGHERQDADEELAAGLERLTGLQERIWAEGKHPVLVVLRP